MSSAAEYFIRSLGQNVYFMHSLGSIVTAVRLIINRLKAKKQKSLIGDISVAWKESPVSVLHQLKADLPFCVNAPVCC